MIKTSPVAAAALAALMLTACEGHGERMAANGALCPDFKATPASSAQANGAALPASDAAAPVDECIKRWAYSLAASRDEADVVGDAVVAACSNPLSKWGQASVAQPPGDEGVSLTTGQPTNPLAEHAAFARGRAVFYVVEARAGRCAAPPVVNGAPAGVG